MDRNIVSPVDILAVSAVALRKESVDRNDGFFWWVEGDRLSLSVRRAWIEISRARIQYCSQPSLSVRRAWIEICGGACGRPSALVALRKESVDRNANPGSTELILPGRSP